MELPPSNNKRKAELDLERRDSSDDDDDDNSKLEDELFKYEQKYGKNRVCQTLAEEGNLQLLKLAWRNKEYKRDVFVCNKAAQFGHLDVLQFAHENDCPFINMEEGEDGSDVCRNAATNGHSEVLNYAFEQGCVIHAGAYAGAASKDGNLKILKLLYKEERRRGEERREKLKQEGKKFDAIDRFSWDIETCGNAAKRGDLPMFRWALAKGCYWNQKECLKYALEHDNDEMIALIYSKGHWDPEEFERIVDKERCQDILLQYGLVV